MQREDGTVTEAATVGVAADAHQPIQWRAAWTVEKYWGGAADVRAGRIEPYDVIEREGNLLLYGGADLMWLGLRGDLTTTLHFDNGLAGIAVGDDATAAAATQTDLQASSASTNREVVGMEATYPLHTTGTGSTAVQDMTFRSVFSTTLGNFVWNEWGIKNTTSSTAGAGRLLNRKVESLGTKTAAATWTFTVKLSLA